MSFYERMIATLKDAGNFYVGLILSLFVVFITCFFSPEITLVLVLVAISVVIFSGILIMIFADFK